MRGLRDFGLGLLLLCVLRVLIGFVAVPKDLVQTASLVVSVLFVLIPIAALFRGASYDWKWKPALLATIAGVFVQGGATLLAPKVGAPLLGGSLDALGQAGLITWCLGIGALLSTALKDRNMLVPIAIFLALFDIWLVFVPEGPVGQIARGSQVSLSRIAYHIPAPTHQSSGGFARALAYIGPADFLFVAMFFSALFKFRMRTQATAIAMAPALAIYLLVVLVFPTVSVGPIALGALPALLPIGTVVLAMNWREFHLVKEEVLTTLVILVLGIALVSWRFSVQPKSRPEPSPSAGAPGEPEYLHSLDIEEASRLRF